MTDAAPVITASLLTAAVLELRDIHQTYGSGETAVQALRGIDLRVERGDYLAIMGPSGSGKSTLMNLLGCLDIATSGQYLLGGVDVSELDDRALAKVRNRQIGFVFQSFNLIPRMTALANVELPLIYGGVRRAERRALALEALELVGLPDRGRHVPDELSGGERQRVTIARALVNEPAIVWADEPTGDLDSANAEEITALLRRLNVERGLTLLIVTHDLAVGRATDRIIRMVDGQVVNQGVLAAA